MSEKYQAHLRKIEQDTARVPCVENPQPESQHCLQPEEQDNVLIFDPMDRESPPNFNQLSSKKTSSNDFEMKMEEEEELMQHTITPPPRYRKSLLQPIEDSSKFPSVLLEQSPKGQRSLQIKIPMYLTTTFLKIETQNYILDIIDPNHAQRTFQIERRYSEFIDLYEFLFYNHPGFILCPLPNKNFTSFFQIKLGLNLQQPGHRVELIERRMLELEKFINSVTHHPLLRNSEQIRIFLSEDRIEFQEGMKRLEKYVKESKDIEKPSQLKNWMNKGKSFWSVYAKQESPKANKKDSAEGSLKGIKFTEIAETILEKKKQLHRIDEQFTKLYEAERNFSQFVDFKTENDTMLKLCAKQSSSKEYCRRFSNTLEIDVLDELAFSLRCLEEAQKAMDYRQEILQSWRASKDTADPNRREKLQRRLDNFETNFLREWDSFQERVDTSSESAMHKFEKAWQEYKKSMLKIWRKRNDNL